MNLVLHRRIISESKSFIAHVVRKIFLGFFLIKKWPELVKEKKKSFFFQKINIDSYILLVLLGYWIPCYIWAYSLYIFWPFKLRSVLSCTPELIEEKKKKFFFSKNQHWQLYLTCLVRLLDPLLDLGPILYFYECKCEISWATFWPFKLHSVLSFTHGI